LKKFSSRTARPSAVRAKLLRGEQKDQEVVFKAKTIVSCAGAFNTYVKLLRSEETADFKTRILDFNKRNPPVSHISIYLALKDSAATLGLKGENHWIYDSYDHDETFARRINWVAKGGRRWHICLCPL
jgi:all-trans-retinol 13,14-reductase